MTRPAIMLPNFAAPDVRLETRDDGSLLLRSPDPLGEYPAQLGIWLRHWAAAAGERCFLAERQGTGWRRIGYAEARASADAIAQALLDRGLGPERPVLILSGNSINHALLTLGAMQAGIPVAPVSPAYSLMSRDFAKVHHIVGLTRPGLVYVEDLAPFAGVLAALDLDGVEVVAARGELPAVDATAFSTLLETRPGAAVEAAFAAVGPDSIAKYLFTSGSTGMPKGVINTQRMLCANQQSIRQVWPMLQDEPPVLVDWLPWNHTFGGNFCFNLVLANGGTFHIDAGKPAPGLIESTAASLREVSPTIYFNVPAGFRALLPYLEAEADLRGNFFSRLKFLFYAGAALPQDLWQRLEAASVAATGARVAMISAWGSTETAPGATAVHWGIEQAGVIGLPIPGVTLKLVPSGGKRELRVKGPNVTPGYLNQHELTEAAFDEEGFYRIGDAGRFVDDGEPLQGLAFDGRVAEDFKLATGTWVHAGGLRVAALEAAAPLLQDAVVTGHDREFVGLLAWPSLPACRALAGLGSEAGDDEVLGSPAVRARIEQSIAAYNAANPASSTRIARVLLLRDAPDVDANEITDKGYINQRAVLERRAGLVEDLHAANPPGEVIRLPD